MQIQTTPCQCKVSFLSAWVQVLGIKEADTKSCTVSWQIYFVRISVDANYISCLSIHSVYTQVNYKLHKSVIYFRLTRTMHSWQNHTNLAIKISDHMSRDPTLITYNASTYGKSTASAFYLFIWFCILFTCLLAACIFASKLSHKAYLFE